MSMKFKNKQNESVLLEVRADLPSGAGVGFRPGGA